MFRHRMNYKNININQCIDIEWIIKIININQCLDIEWIIKILI